MVLTGGVVVESFVAVVVVSSVVGVVGVVTVWDGGVGVVTF